MSKKRVDFAIITAIEVEREAICKALDIHAKDRLQEGNRTYWFKSLPLSNDYLYNIVVAQCLDIANLNAGLLTKDILDHWNPRAVLMVGVAATAKSESEQHLGDIVIAKEIAYYEGGKITAEGKEPEPKQVPVDDILLSRAQFLPKSDFPILADRPDQSDIRPQIHVGVIASSDTVIADAKTRDEIAAFNRKTLALEMEGYGVIEATRQRNNYKNYVGCLIIRALCDYGNNDKNDLWKSYAAAAVAGFTRYFLLDKPIKPINFNNQQREIDKCKQELEDNQANRKSCQEQLRRTFEILNQLQEDQKNLESKLKELEGSEETSQREERENSQQLEELCKEIIQSWKRGKLNIWLGPDINFCGRPIKDGKPEEWSESSSYPPVDFEIAKYLIKKYGNLYTSMKGSDCNCPILSDKDHHTIRFECPFTDLAYISQYIHDILGEYNLYRELFPIFEHDYYTNEVHKFIVNLVEQSNKSNHSGSFPVIITTNYDHTLEKALCNAEQAFDLVSYIPNGEYCGKFQHHAPPFYKYPPEHQGNIMELTYSNFDLEKRPVVLKLCSGVFTDQEHNIFGFSAFSSRLASQLPNRLLSRLQWQDILFLGYSLQTRKAQKLLSLFDLPSKKGRNKQFRWIIQNKITSEERKEWETYTDNQRVFDLNLSFFVKEINKLLIE